MKRKDDISLLGEEYKRQVGEANYDNENVTIKTITKDYSDKFNNLQVCFLSDMHIGSSDFSMQSLMETLKYAVSQENAIIFMLGDALNTAIVGSKSDTYEDILNPQSQLDIFSKVLSIAKGDKELVKVLKDLNDTGKIVVLHSGNHEDRINKSVGISTIKSAADIAGVSDAFAPYFASTNLVLRQSKSPDGKFNFRVVTHHGTGIKNIDGVFRLLRNVDNANLCVIGHTHQTSMKNERLIKLDENGEQYYSDVVYLTLPASGGGTYGAGMALPDIYKQSGIWLAISSQPNPFAGQISATGIKYPDFIPAIAQFTPTNVMDTNIKQKRYRDAKSVITEVEAKQAQKVYDLMKQTIDAITDYEKIIREGVKEKITEKPRKTPKGFLEYLENKDTNTKEDTEGNGRDM